MATQEQEQTRDAWDRSSVTAVLAAAGVVGPILFTAVAHAQSLLRGDHSLVADPSSSGLHAWMGLYEWVMVAVWLICTIVLEFRFLRVTQATGAH